MDELAQLEAVNQRLDDQDYLIITNYKQYRSLVQALPVGIFQTDLIGKVIYVNPKLISILERKQEELLADGWIDSIHPKDKDRVIAEWKNSLKEKIDFYSEFRFITASGVTHKVISRAAPINDSKGKLIGYVGTYDVIGRG